jgi:chorismate mutase
MTAHTPDNALDAIRREIDVIDDQVLDLLERRFAATRRVKATKASDGSIASSPFRPAREAAMLRRLIARGGAAVSPDIVVRLWRVILSASTQLQAHVTLHLDEALGHDLGTRLLIGEHFCAMQVHLHGSPSQALEALRTSRGDLAIVGTNSDWAQHFSPESKGSARVIGTLPAISGGSQPTLLVFGHAEPQETGDDETLVLTHGESPKLPSALWQAVAGRFTLTGLPGFLSDSALLREPISRLPGACIAGRCPRPFKVSS